MIAPVRLLLIEDSPSYAALVLVLIAEEFGRAVTTRRAATLAEGRDTLAADGADCVLLDLTLPDGEGPGLLDVLRAVDPAVRIVVLSGRSDPRIAEEALRRGAAAFVAKGRERAELFSALAVPQAASS